METRSPGVPPVAGASFFPCSKHKTTLAGPLAAYANAFHARALDTTALAAITVVGAALPLRGGIVMSVTGRRIIFVLQTPLIGADTILALGAGIAIGMKYASEGRR